MLLKIKADLHVYAFESVSALAVLVIFNSNFDASLQTNNKQNIQAVKTHSTMNAGWFISSACDRGLMRRPVLEEHIR